VKFKTALAAAAAFTLATAAQAQMGPETGATVYESTDGEVGGVIGTIVQMDGETIVVDIDGMKASLPAGAFGEGPEGPVIAVTKAQLVQMLQAQNEQAVAARDAALVADAAVFDSEGAQIGTIQSVDGDSAVLEMTEGAVTVQREQFAADQNGVLLVLIPRADLVAALGGEPAPAPQGGEMAEQDAE